MNNQRLNSKFFEAMLEEAVIEDFENKIKNIEKNQSDDNHVFSSDFEKNMNKLFKKNRQKIFYNKTKRILSKVAIWVIALFIISSIGLLSVQASRVFIFNAVLEWKDKYVSVKFEDDNEATLKKSGEYSINYISDGLKIYDKKVNGANISIRYKNKADIIIYLSWRPITDAGELLVDSENTNYYKTKINGYEAYVFEAKSINDRNIIVWQDKDNTLKLFSTIKVDELIKMAESIYKN